MLMVILMGCLGADESGGAPTMQGWQTYTCEDGLVELPYTEPFPLVVWAMSDGAWHIAGDADNLRVSVSDAGASIRVTSSYPCRVFVAE